MRTPITIAFCAAMLLVHAQVPSKISPALSAHLSANKSGMVDLFVRGETGSIAAEVEVLGGTVKMRMGNLLSVRIPNRSVRILAGKGCVKGFEFSLSRPRVLNDSSRVHSHIQEIHEGLPALPQAYDGTAVVMGIIDTGLDMDHPDFKNADGSTRVVKYWDQTKPADATSPAAYGYGQACDSAAINAGTCTFGEQGGSFGHGTTVAGTASGTGLATGTNKGGAPGGDLIIVSSDFDAANWTSVVADAVEYIFNEADAMGKPAVVNISLGDYLGSHDGEDAAAKFIDSLLVAKEGRVLVCAAGNSFDWPKYHLGTDVTADTTFTWFQYNATSALGHGAVYFEAWADLADLNNVSYAIGADKVSPSFEFRGRTPFHDIQSNVGVLISDSLRSSAGDLLGVVEFWAEQRGGQYHLTVHIEEPDSSDYNFRFMSTGMGRFDIWTADFLGFSTMETSIPSVAQFPAIANYVLPDNAQTMVSSWACSDQVITVANYTNEVSYIDVNGNPQSVPGTEGDITATSSAGPTRDGRVKPNISAPGDITLTAAPFLQLTTLTANEPHKVAAGGMHIRQGGTSIASPVVAAAAALYLQKCPKALYSEIRDALLTTSTADAFTGTLPNTRWGAGKLHAFDALLTSNYSVDISVFGDSALCPGDSVLISGPILNTFLWSTGDTTKVFWLSTTGPLYVTTTNAAGCIAYSDTINIVQHPAPSIPTISQSGNVLSSSSAFQYQWLFEGGPLSGETSQQLTAVTTGNYQMLVTDANGCTAISDTIYYLNVGLATALSSAGVSIWPSPTAGPVNISISTELLQDSPLLVITDAKGVEVWSTRMSPSKADLVLNEKFAAGIYTLLLRTNTLSVNVVKRFEILSK